CVINHALKSTPQRRGVSGVRFVFQRPEDAAGDRGDIGVAGPTSDGEAIRHLDQVPVCIGKLVFRIAHRRPRHQSWRSKNHPTVHAGTGGSLAWTSSEVIHTSATHGVEEVAVTLL